MSIEVTNKSNVQYTFIQIWCIFLHVCIFNTNVNSPHDPIYIVNPELFNVRPDNIVPIVLAYNLSHYESLHPRTDSDIQATINLVIDYQEGRYQFKRKDFPMLLNFENKQGNNTTEKYPAKKEILETDCTNYSCRFQIPH